MAPSRLHRLLLALGVTLLLPNGLHGATNASAQSGAGPQPGCTTLYVSDGQTALAGNNEDFNNPLTYLWFIPASPGRYGRVLFGYDDYVPQGGLNDQGVFFDGLALPYKDMPETSARPSYPAGELAYLDDLLARSANVQEVVDSVSQWNRLGGEFSQALYGDRFGESVIIDGDTILWKDGAFQLATNFRLAENPNPPYPDERFGVLSDLLSQADQFDVALIRRALDLAHAEGDTPTLYSQVYELNTGIIHLYQFHNFREEVVLNLADELAKGPHVVRLASLFPPNEALEQWAARRERQWRVEVAGLIETSVSPASQAWMSGSYVLQRGDEAAAVTIYQDGEQLYLQQPNQLPIELFPAAPDTVFHRFYNGFDLTLTFERNLWGQVSGAEGSFSFEPYELSLPYALTRSGVASYAASLWITAAGAALVLVLAGALLWARARRGPNLRPATKDQI
jgi:hypothetical protein